MSRGFTLIELLIVLFIASVLLGIGVPSFQTMLQNNRLTVVANELAGALSFARMEAVRRGNEVVFGQRNGADWAGGMVVYQDTNGDGDYDVGEELRLWEPLAGGGTVTIAQSSLTFKANGTVNTATTATICDSRTGETGRELSLLISGTFSISKKTCS
ncbi:GspH/FimT family pseudopilin [Simiduia sp. 21SJ11W-1]|uniref:GspH/FimT family pseudopilin n=1 Tax=Simiduia sp. 21SJ11W-1 TaxID=2909669 RepID=UPI00209D29D0|nr:GspH/FimT family pseudopilin [Simiduia sp. 21SJ11W-1]UTA47336.1 GspH/FimT family pseudopilin [Simiduia sp. 21SJ11W-1]